MRGTKQVGIWSEMRSFWQPHPTQDQPAPPEGFEIDSRIGAAAPRAPTVSKEDSRPQAILKFRPPSSLDYKARHGPQTWKLIVLYVCLSCRARVCVFVRHTLGSQNIANKSSLVRARSKKNAF